MELQRNFELVLAIARFCGDFVDASQKSVPGVLWFVKDFC